MGTDLGKSVKIEDRVYTTGEAAEICGLSNTIIRKLFDEGKLKGFLIPMRARERRITSNSLIKFMEENSIIKDERYYTTGEIAKICNVSPRTVSSWFDRGRLNGYYIPGSRDRRITHESLIEFMKENKMYEYLKDNIPK